MNGFLFVMGEDGVGEDLYGGMIHDWFGNCKVWVKRLPVVVGFMWVGSFCEFGVFWDTRYTPFANSGSFGVHGIHDSSLVGENGVLWMGLLVALAFKTLITLYMPSAVWDRQHGIDSTE